MMTIPDILYAVVVLAVLVAAAFWWVRFRPVSNPIGAGAAAALFVSPETLRTLSTAPETLAPSLVSQRSVCDGYDCLLSDGSVVHFASQPADATLAVSDYLTARSAAEEAAKVTYIILGESSG